MNFLEAVAVMCPGVSLECSNISDIVPNKLQNNEGVSKLLKYHEAPFIVLEMSLLM
jgi:hypothetical protein